MNEVIMFLAYWAVLLIGISGVFVISGYLLAKALNVILNFFKLSNALARFYHEHRRLKKQGKSIKDVYGKPSVYTPKVKEDLFK